MPESFFHGLCLHFAAAGKVTPSHTLLHIKDCYSNKVYTIVVDAGSPTRESEQSCITNLSVDATFLTHPHVDHGGHAYYVHIRNPEAPIFVAKGSKIVHSTMLLDAWKHEQKSIELGLVHTSEALCRDWLHEIERWERVLNGGIRRNRKGRNRKTLTVQQEKDTLNEIELRIDAWRGQIHARIGEYYPLDDDHTENIARAIDQYFIMKKRELKRQGVVTNEDVHATISALQERTLGKTHAIILGKTLKRGNPVQTTLQFKMLDSGHLATCPATQLLLTARGRNILFSGDRGNNDRPKPYPCPDDSQLENAADFLVLESTYGGKNRTNREQELEHMIQLILRAKHCGEDIIIPSISLDRPLVVLYEIVTRLFETGVLTAGEVDIYYFGNLIDELLRIVPRNHPMWLAIRKHVKPLRKDQLKSLQKPGNRPRIIIGGGGFLPPDGSPIGAVLEQALSQKNLTIIFPNYYGEPTSNAGNLMNGRPFSLTRENQAPRELGPGHKAYYISGFSSHADHDQLVDYAAFVMRENGTIFLNHGTDEARMALKIALLQDPRIKAKKITVVIPKKGKDYVLKKV